MRTSGGLEARLMLMMFLQFFIWGAWYATGGNYMKSHGLSDAIYLAYMASPIGSIVAPFFLGMIADRLFPVQRVLGARVMTAFERLMGLILTAMAVEMLLAGIRAYLKTL